MLSRFRRSCATVVALVALGSPHSSYAQGGELERALGFEAASDWQLAGGSGSLSSVAALSQGTSALEVSGNAWRRIRSNALVIGEVGSTLGLDVLLRSGPAGWETLGVVLEIPSANLYWQDLGTQSLTGSAGEVRSLAFSLPENVRSALAADHQAFINVVFNGGQAFALDRLDLGLTAPPPDPPPGSSAGCVTHDLQIVDVRADFRDIWAGREDIATGKRSEFFPTIELGFNKNVEVERVPVWLVGLTAGDDETPSDCIDSSGNPIAAVTLHHAPLTSELGASGWSIDLEGAQQSAPLDFNLVAFDDVSGVPDVQGALFAGGDVTLQNFSVNQLSQRPVGLLVGGRLTATNGTIRGDLVRGAIAPSLTAVTLTGAHRTGVSVDPGELAQRLTSMSQALGAFAANGTAQLSYTELTLAGSDPALNVFTVASATLAAARSIRLAVPGSSAALVNVSGEEVTVTNAQISLGPTPRGAVLWNLPNATELTLSSLSFQGSALAPGAAALVNQGNFEGTLVARTVTGNMEFHAYPLTSWEAFGGASLASTVTLKPRARLRAGCEYQLIVGRYPTTPDGSCLPETFVQSFLVSDNGKTAFDREVAARRYDADLKVPASFAAKDGINTPVNDVFRRYGAALNLRKGIDELVATGPSVPSPLEPSRQMTHFRQLFQGIPVQGHGYVVEHESGIFRSALGKVLPGIELSVTPSISVQQAIAAALAAVNPAVRPWEQTPPAGAPPEAELLFRPMRHDPAAPDLRLAYRVRFFGIAESLYVDVDATNGAVLFDQQRARHVTACNGFDTAQVTLERHEARSVTIPFNDATNVARTDLTLGFWSQGNTLHQAFNNTDPFRHRTAFAVQRSDNPADLGVTDYVCAGNDAETRHVATAHWAVQNAERAFFDVLGWPGIRGPDAGEPRLVTSVLSAPANSPYITSFSNATAVSEPDTIQVLAKELFPGNVAHEFAHGVSLYSRLALNGDLLEYRAESGALEEGYGDIMAALAIHRAVGTGGVDPFCMTIDGAGCNRNLAVPNASTDGRLPDTYEGPDFKPIEDDCNRANGLCWIHDNSTIASHWAYKVIHGQDDTEINDHGCSVAVTPLHADFEVALEDTARIVFEGFRMLEGSDGFLAARTTTSFAASQLLGSEAQRSVESAWHAVGVGKGPPPLIIGPDDGATDVEPWSTRFLFTVGDDDGPWVVRYSKDADFADAEFVVIPSAVEIDSVRYARAFVALDAGTKYYWQGRDGDDTTNGPAWDRCNTFSASFTTSEKPIHVTVPTSATRGGYYLTNNMGQFAWEPVGNANRYEVLVHDTTDGCAVPQSEWTVVPVNFQRLHPPEVFLGDTIDQNLVLLREPIRLRPDEVFDEDRTYHLFVRAMNGAAQGTCQHFEVRKTKLLPFQKLSPLDYATIPYASGGPFVWTPSEGAESYEIAIGRFPPDEPLQTVLRETVDAHEIVLNANGDVEYTLHDTSVTTLSGEMRWSVEAVHPTGERRSGWDPGAPDFTTSASFWNGAQQITEAFSDGGEHAPMLDTLRIPVTFVFPVDQTQRDTETCFVVPDNTVGLYWWFGPTAIPQIPADEYVDLHVAPGTTEVCTTRLDLSAEEPMMLVVYPYSNFVLGSPQGSFGPPTVFLMQETTCGAAGDPCCQPTNSCVEGAVCQGGTCVSCGARGEPCCDGRCDHVQQLVCAGTECIDCGGKDQPCCPQGRGEPGTWCHSDNRCFGSYCRECGDAGERCCRAVTQEAICFGKAECDTSTDRCENPVECNAKMEAGSDAAESHNVYMGKLGGNAMLFFDSFDVPDRIVARYEGSVVASTGCIGTDDLAYGCQWIEDEQLGTDAEVCCDATGLCSLAFAYGRGSTVSLVVDVIPNCAKQGRTEWMFKVSCPD